MLFFIELVAAMVVAWIVAPFALLVVLGILGGLLVEIPRAWHAQRGWRTLLIPAVFTVLTLLGAVASVVLER